jgi:hypothetical protein
VSGYPVGRRSRDGPIGTSKQTKTTGTNQDRRIIVMRAEIYARTAAAGEDVIALQQESCRLAAEANGDVVVAVFADDGWSGIGLDRPGLKALRDALGSGAIDMLWCLSVDRLSRDPAALMALLDEMAPHQVQVRFVGGPGLEDGEVRWWASLWAPAAAQAVPVRRAWGRPASSGERYGR